MSQPFIKPQSMGLINLPNKSKYIENGMFIKIAENEIHHPLKMAKIGQLQGDSDSFWEYTTAQMEPDLKIQLSKDKSFDFKLKCNSSKF